MTKNLSSPLRVTALFALCLLPGYGALITYTSLNNFNRAAPGLPTDNFSATLASPDRYTACAGPISSSIPNDCFPLGGLLPGVTYNASPEPLFVSRPAVRPGEFLTTFLAVSDHASLDLTFANVSAVGFTLYIGLIPAESDISVFSATGTLLGIFGALVNGTSFFGVVSDADRIGKISINNPGSWPATIENVSFGVPTTATPEPGTWLLIGLGLLATKRRKGNQLRGQTPLTELGQK